MMKWIIIKQKQNVKITNLKSLEKYSQVALINPWTLDNIQNIIESNGNNSFNEHAHWKTLWSIGDKKNRRHAPQIIVTWNNW